MKLHPKNMNFRQAMVASYYLLSPNERRRGLAVALLSFFGGAADVIAVLAVYPLISVLVQPDLVQTNTDIRQIWDFLGGESIKNFVLTLAVAASGVVIFGSGLNFFAQLQANRFAASCQERLGRDLMKALLQAPYIWHLERSPLVLGSFFQNHIVLWSRDVVRRIATMVGQLAMIVLPAATLIGWSPINGILIMITAVLSLTFLLGFVRRHTTSLLRQKKQAEQQLYVFLTEALQGIKDLKLSSRENDFLNTFMRSYHIYSQNFSAANNWTLLPTQLVLIIGQLGILGVGVVMFLNGIDGGSLASTMAIVVLVASRVFPAMNRMGTAINGLNNVIGWIETLDETLVSLPPMQERSTISKETPRRLQWHEIVIQEASFTYPNAGAPALYSSSLSLCRGGSYAFAGSSGAGKSTLVDLILGLLEPTTGSVKVDGKKIDGIIKTAWQAGIGYVPQLPMISSATLRENIAFGIPREKIDDERVGQCLALAHLMDVLGELPGGLDTYLGDRGVRLSGGQRQRVAIARALYNDPEVLVLDEATSALDTLSEHAIRDALMDLHGKITIISVAHRFSTIRSCDSIFLMEKGRVVAEGTFDMLLQNSDLFRQLVDGYEVDLHKE